MLYPFYPYLCEKVTKIPWKPSAAALLASSLSPVSTMPRESTPSLPLTIRSMAWPTISWPSETHGFCVGQRQQKLWRVWKLLGGGGYVWFKPQQKSCSCSCSSQLNHQPFPNGRFLIGFSHITFKPSWQTLSPWPVSRRWRGVCRPWSSCSFSTSQLRSWRGIQEGHRKNFPVWRSLPGLVNVNITIWKDPPCY